MKYENVLLVVQHDDNDVNKWYFDVMKTPLLTHKLNHMSHMNVNDKSIE